MRTGILCVVAASSKTCSDTAHSVTVMAGNLVQVQVSLATGQYAAELSSEQHFSGAVMASYDTKSLSVLAGWHRCSSALHLNQHDLQSAVVCACSRWRRVGRSRRAADGEKLSSSKNRKFRKI